MSGHGTRARRGVLLTVVVAVVACSCALGDGSSPPGSPSGGAAPDPTASSAGAHAAQLEALVSDARADEGLEPPVHDDCAATIAARRADELVGADLLTHRPLDDALESCGVALAAENLSRSGAPPADVVDAWLGSAGHAANIRNPRFTRAAVACTQDGTEEGAARMVCVQVFLAE